MRSQRFLNWALLIGVASIGVALDQVSKHLVRQNLAVGESWAPIPALARFFTFTHVQNTGVSFGQMPGLGWLFMLVNLAVLIGIVVYYPRIPAGYWSARLAAGLILAGDLGNVIDRLSTAAMQLDSAGSLMAALRQAYVTDFFNVRIWPVWNVADMCVVSGVAILAWQLWRVENTEADGHPVTDGG